MNKDLDAETKKYLPKMWVAAPDDGPSLSPLLLLLL
jgi:hypothetical protein